MPFPGEMLRVVQNQASNNQDALIVRLRELLCPFLGDPGTRNDLIAVSIEDPRIGDEHLADVLHLDLPELMEIWEARPISLFSCLHPACRASIPVRNRTHLLHLRRLDRYFGFKFGADDLVELKALCEMLCEGCTQGIQHCRDEELRAALLARQARASELRRMPFEQYRTTPEWKSRRNRVLLRAGNKCELCGTRGRLDCHHRTYERYGEEQLGDLIALCRSCHQRFHGINPGAA